ncbi:hypothetical protein [Ruegeria denitrificans]|uniref:hypothetical protein n=1 Tax=Ruegeria denitrificans TaxID=1715692 RepID=UPI00103A8E7C|nr:hypothetical protein [Ruegeria denitrificans]
MTILNSTPQNCAPINYDCALGALSIHKRINLAHLLMRDACLHRPAKMRHQMSQYYTNSHHLRKKLPKIPP